MARKQNGFGNSKSFAFKGGGRVDKGKKVASVGGWPSDRSFGSIVKPTVIQRFNKLSNWVQWRKGLELWNKGLYVDFDFGEIFAELFASCAFIQKVTFKSFRFPSSSIDNAAHYVTKRIPESSEPFGSILSPYEGVEDVVVDDTKASSLSNQIANKERWYFFEPFAAYPVLHRILNERITSIATQYDDRIATSAVVKNIISAATGRPAIYEGHTDGKTAKIKILVPDRTFKDQSEANSVIGNNCTLVGTPLYVSHPSGSTVGESETSPYIEDVDNERIKYVQRSFIKHTVQNGEPVIYDQTSVSRSSIDGASYTATQVGYIKDPNIIGGVQEDGGGALGQRLIIFDKAKKLEEVRTSEFVASTNSYWKLHGEPIIGNSTNSQLGNSVAISNAGAYIGASGADIYNMHIGDGSVKINQYHYDMNKEWIPIGDITLVSPQDPYGDSVCINNLGTRIVFADGNGSAIIKVKIRHTSINTATEPLDIDLQYWEYINDNSGSGSALSLAPNSPVIPGGTWGNDIDINEDGTVLVAGNYKTQSSSNNNLFNVGAVVVYEDDVAWSQKGPALEGTIANQQFGYKVAIDDAGDRIIVASRKVLPTGYIGLSNFYGEVNVYTYLNFTSSFMLSFSRSGTVHGGTCEEVAISGDGKTIAMNFDNVGAGNKGRVEVFRYTSGWQQLGDTFVGSTGDQLGTGLSLSQDGNRIVIGAPGDGTVKSYVKVFDYNSTSLKWEQVGQTIYTDELEHVDASSAEFGKNVEITNNGKRIVVGSPKANGIASGNQNGAVFAYDLIAPKNNPLIVDKENLLKVTNCAYTIESEVFFEKSKYQRFFPNEFNAQELRDSVSHDCTVIPSGLIISNVYSRDITATGPLTWVVEIEPVSLTTYLVRPGRDRVPDPSNPGNTIIANLYYLVLSTPSMARISSNEIDINVDPYTDVIYSPTAPNWNQLRLDSQWTCDCPVYSRAKIRSPETLSPDKTRSINRQDRYPLPSSGSENKSVFLSNNNENAGAINSWATPSHNLEFKMCQHTVAAWLSDGYKFVEPSEYPMMEERYELEQQIVNEFANKKFKVDTSQRSEIQRTNFFWTLMQNLNGITSKIFEDKPISTHEFGLNDLEVEQSQIIDFDPTGAPAGSSGLGQKDPNDPDEVDFTTTFEPGFLD